MADKPILFSGPMVRAIVEGRKTQTRRILKPQPDPEFIRAEIGAKRFVLQPAFLFASDTHRAFLRVPRPGDRLWVREAWRTDDLFDFSKPSDLDVATPIRMEADGRWFNPYEMEFGEEGKLRPSMFMPRWASRLTLEVLAVKVERLQDISGNDAQAEGILIGGADVDVYRRESERNHEAARRWNAYRIRQFRDLWASINGPGSWDENPWVVAVLFKPVFQNIDDNLLKVKA